MTDIDVQTVASARAGLTTALRKFRTGDSSPVILGSHRRPEAVLMSYAQFASGSGDEREPLLEQLRRRRELILSLAEHSRMSDVHVTGSVARAEERADSDVDFIVTPAPGATLFDLARFELDLELLLERQVDVMSSGALDPFTDARLLSDAVPL